MSDIYYDFDLLQECILLRRDLHQIPEAGFCEQKTSTYVQKYLERLQPDCIKTLAGTGVKAVFYAQNADSTIAFRADMDALPVMESASHSYKSCNAGFMHACGHDGHMAVALATARLVSLNRSKLRQNVVFLFQPAEEGRCGAKAVIEAGALDAPHIDRIYGYHLWPQIPIGKIGIRGGTFMSRAHGFDVTINGKSGHGARPHEGRDCIVAAAWLISAMQTVVSRSIDPMDSAALSVGAVHGGEVRNIICDNVTLKATLRTFSDAAFNNAQTSINMLLHGCASAFGVTVTKHIVQDYYAVINDEELASRMRELAPDMAVAIDMQPISEDFSFYQRKTRGLFMALGIGDVPALHSPNFDFDENALTYGVIANARLIFG